MKKFITSLLCVSTILTATAADIYVNNSGQTGTYTTISAAIAASAPGDRIFVSPYEDYTENLTISQNMTIASAVAGTSFSVVGTLTIQGTPNMDVRIIGGAFSGNILCQTGATGLNTMADVYITDCDFSSFDAQEFIRVHLLFCELSGSVVSLEHGEVRGNTGLSSLYINDGPNAGIGDTLFIVGNTFSGSGFIDWQNDDNYFWIANNKIGRPNNGSCFRLDKHHYSSLVNNVLVNNYFYNNAGLGIQTTIYSTSPANVDNVHLINNIVENIYSNAFAISGINNTNNSKFKLYYNLIIGNSLTSIATEIVGNKVFSGSNAFTVTVDDKGRCLLPECVDKGSRSLQFYDIDMTRNDIGTYGGPTSIDNYLGEGNGSGRVYDLQMPFEIWSGQTPQVKANAVNTK